MALGPGHTAAASGYTLQHFFMTPSISSNASFPLTVHHVINRVDALLNIIEMDLPHRECHIVKSNLGKWFRFN